MRNRMYGGVRGRKTKVGRKLLRFPPTRFRVLSLILLRPLTLAGPKVFFCQIFANLKVCHDDEMTLGSGSFSGISQQLPKRW